MGNFFSRGQAYSKSTAVQPGRGDPRAAASRGESSDHNNMGEGCLIFYFYTGGTAELNFLNPPW